MTGQAPTRGQRRKALTAAAILDAARQLFFANGVARTTIDEIAERADVSVGSVYFHFRSKEGVYLALVEEALDVNERFMADVPGDPSPLARILAAGEAYLRFHLERPDAFRLVALRMLEPPVGADLSEAEQRIADRVERLVGAVGADLQAAIDAGEVRPIAAVDGMRFLWGAWNGVIALSLRQDRLRLTDDEVRAALAEGRAIIERGLAV
ncbi:TetR/AcrR family transcriptional regulator [Conexibacter woesei]|uniref:Transcriptional regulator, TetR family n=1 Tax=Conexibacter woesei (strain DSM 14684 / CCUG 47730 / CIP 108061 / JCM 11494 / NBRC 100937 / ID131577) TaxID=469383 RepID=D3FB83_CONWI|nr:TetR/AcrR family transcriptional regulator [Conexibacter woesei]ADB53275.1 transcriptional regulator, TetR family [Conexibacter woesei DSM 14684]